MTYISTVRINIQANYKKKMSEKILRKIDKNESYFVFSNDLTHVSRLFRISSEIDYFQNLGLFKKTIQKWILLHPLLTAKIGLVESELYFVSTEPDAELKNVQFYNIDSESLINSNKPTQKQYDEIIDLLLENESFSKLSNDDKLWRLTFIKQTNTVNDFDIIFSIHHSITEGRNVCYIFLQLLAPQNKH